MSNRLRDEDPNNYMRYSIGLTAVVIAAAAVAGANMVSLVAERSGGPIVAFLSAKSAPTARTGPGAPRFDNVDYGATGSIHNFLDRPVVLDPCTGREK